MIQEQLRCGCMTMTDKSPVRNNYKEHVVYALTLIANEVISIFIIPILLTSTIYVL